VVDKALSVDPNRRYTSAEELRGRLQAVQLQLDPGCGPETVMRYMRESFSVEFIRERPVIAGLSAAALQAGEDVAQRTRSFLVNTPLPPRSTPSGPSPRHAAKRAPAPAAGLPPADDTTRHPVDAILSPGGVTTWTDRPTPSPGT